jgi:GntR family galactonate operon transcriptional repressor
MKLAKTFEENRSRVPYKRGLYHYVVSDIALQILSGDIKPGTRISTEQQLCEQYSVSRTVIRDALRILADKGLIEARPKSGTLVRNIEHWNFLDPELIVWAQGLGDRTGFFEVLLEARNTIEPQVVALAAQKATAEDIAKIEIAYEGMVAAFEQDKPDIEGFTTSDLEFHLAILESTHNIILKQFGVLILAALRISFELALEFESISEESLRNHGKILEAIKSRDSKRASECLVTIADILHSRLRKNPGSK